MGATNVWTAASASYYTWSKIFGTVAVLFLAVTMYWLLFGTEMMTSSCFNSLTGLTGTLMLLASIICYDISTLNPATSHTFDTLFIHYLAVRLLAIFGWYASWSFLKHCNTVKLQQKILLQHILRTNSDTIYGQDFKFGSIKSYEEFKRYHPVVGYKHVKPYVDKIVNYGTNNVLTRSDPVYLAVTSGSTGKQKSIPLTNDSIKTKFWMYIYVMESPRRKGIQVNLLKTVLIWSSPNAQDTPGGLPTGTAARFEMNMGLKHGKRGLAMLTVNPAVFDIMQENLAFHIHAVFALREREVGRFECLFASQLLDFWRYVLHNADVICSAIEMGMLSNNLDLPAKLRKTLNADLMPDKERAHEVLAELRKGSVELSRRLWPHLSVCATVVTGSMTVYANSLKRTFMQGVAMSTPLHAGTECSYGVNLSRGIDDYYSLALLYHNGFFEFIHEHHCDQKGAPTLLAHELTVGECYELVVTTTTGLYRYRVGDVVKIVKYEGQCPIYEFKYRTGNMLNVLYERTPECVLQSSVLNAVKQLNISLVDFTATEHIYYTGTDDLEGTARGYVLFIEIEGSERLKQTELNVFDEQLCEEAESYHKLRKNKSIVALKVKQLVSGSFAACVQQMTNKERNSQFKMPRVIRNRQYLEFLTSRILLTDN